MNTYKRHRFPPDIISYAVCLYYRFNLSHRDIEDLLSQRGITYENNRAEQSHEATRVRERGMRKFKSVKQAQRFLCTHAAVSNLFNLGRHLIRAEHYRALRVSAFTEWERAVA
jgi:putative transposase